MIKEDTINYSDFFTWAYSKLSNRYTKSEIELFIKWIVEDFTKSSTNNTKAENTSRQIVKGILALESGKPIQQILGQVEFSDAIIKVTQDVMIPRPETEEMLQLALAKISKTQKEGKMLDICAGSGCLAISWQKKQPDWQVTGIEIDEKALDVAKHNARINNVSINWKQKNILQPFINEKTKYDVVLSNPPYIPVSEQIEMDRTVVDFEPHKALFVPDDNPLLFYRAIFSQIINHLSKTGFIFVECHYNFAEKVAELAKNYGFNKQIIKKDMYGKQRFVFAAL